MIWKPGLQPFLLMQFVLLFSLFTIAVVASTAKSLFKAVIWIFTPVVKDTEQYI
jgi:hypothetical protein